jgi:nucleotide-binding universal stress UspA family protein
MADDNLTPDQTSHPPVVVGVDGSDHSLAAADLAAEEAAARGAPLEIVHAYLPSVLSRPATAPVDLPLAGAAPALDEPALRGHAERVLHDAAARVRAGRPDLAVITRLRDGLPAGVLTDASRQAVLVVVGHRGAGGFTGLLTGSVGVQLASHAACPVVVVRGDRDPDGPVVVGVDGSEGSQRAAGFAAETADRYGVPLVALYGWAAVPGWAPELAQAGQPPPGVPDEVAATVAELTRRFPRLPVRAEVRQHVPPHEALVTAAKGARLVVVGSRGLGGFRGLLLGSVSQALIHHAGCPVAVVGPAATPTPGDRGQ